MALPISFDHPFTPPDPLPKPPGDLLAWLRRLPKVPARVWVQFSAGSESGVELGRHWFGFGSFRPELRAKPEEIGGAVAALIDGHHRRELVGDDLQRTREPGRYRVMVLMSEGGERRELVLQAVP